MHFREVDGGEMLGINTLGQQKLEIRVEILHSVHLIYSAICKITMARLEMIFYKITMTLLPETGLKVCILKYRGCPI